MVREPQFAQTGQSISVNSRTETTVRATFVLEIANSATMTMSASSVKESFGKGIYTKSDGGKYDGEWKDDQYWTGNEYCKEGKLVGRYLKGKRQPLKKRKKRKPAPLSLFPR